MGEHSQDQLPNCVRALSKRTDSDRSVLTVPMKRHGAGALAQLLQDGISIPGTRPNGVLVMEYTVASLDARGEPASNIAWAETGMLLVFMPFDKQRIVIMLSCT